jgi:beta-glucosidase
VSGARFPEDFLWGAATSSYQVEGEIEGNDWHLFTTSPAIQRRVRALTALAGRPVALRPAGVAAGHRDLGVLRADLARAAGLGLNAYRFSLEWARLQPASGAPLDAEAVDYYRAVADACREAGLTPVVTINHFTLPAWVLAPPRRGFRRSLRGWEDDRTVDAFVGYAEQAVAALGPRVDRWLTLNEPVGAVAAGYLAGLWPPGFVLAVGRARRAIRNLARGHVRAYERIRTVAPAARVSFAHAVLHSRPLESLVTWRFLDAVMPALDFVAVNYYGAVRMRRALRGDIGWPISPSALGNLLRAIHKRYGLPVLITENGLAEAQDRNRAPYLVAHLQQVLDAIEADVRVEGYLAWTLVDNYEWHHGYRDAARFGLFTVDRGARRVTEGALALRSVIAARRTDAAVPAFGTIEPGGRRMVPPACSAGRVWAGPVAGGRALQVSGHGELDALLLLADGQTWVALDDVEWHPERRTLCFAHGESTFRAHVTGDRLVGEGWEAHLLWPAGAWHGGAALPRFVLRWNGAGWTGKRLVTAWEPLARIEWNGRALRLEDGDGTRFEGATAGGVLTGVRLAPNGGCRPWRARRLPDGLPF